MPPASVAEAVKAMAGSFDLAVVIPKVVKHLTAGAITVNALH